MKRRFHVCWLGTDYTEAAKVKETFKLEFPDVEFQIRRRKIQFELVKRLPSKEAVQENLKENPLGNPFNKRRKKKRNYRTPTP